MPAHIVVTNKQIYYVQHFTLDTVFGTPLTYYNLVNKPNGIVGWLIPY